MHRGQPPPKGQEIVDRLSAGQLRGDVLAMIAEFAGRHNQLPSFLFGVDTIDLDLT